MPDTTPTLRDRIRRAICEASGFTWLPDELMEPDEYGEHADAVLAVLPAASAPTAPADRATDRRDRYAAAIRDTDGWVLDGGQHMLDAVMAVADAEQADLRAGVAELRAELDKLIRWHKEDGDQAAKMRQAIERLRAERADLIRQRDQIAMDTIKALAAPADQDARRRLTPSEHDRAWHAIEGSAGEEGADPGTVLNAVLHALRIDPPTADEAQPTETGAPRLLWSDLLGADPDFTGGACTQCYMDRVRDRERDMSPEHAHCRAALDDEPTAATEEPQP